MLIITRVQSEAQTEIHISKAQTAPDGDSVSQWCIYEFSFLNK